MDNAPVEPDEVEVDELDLVDQYFNSVYSALKEMGVPDDRLPTTVQVLSHVMECCDQSRLDAWMRAYAAAESPALEKGAG
jgi:hypothetical protein